MPPHRSPAARQAHSLSFRPHQSRLVYIAHVPPPVHPHTCRSLLFSSLVSLCLFWTYLPEPSPIPYTNHASPPHSPLAMPIPVPIMSYISESKSCPGHTGACCPKLALALHVYLWLPSYNLLYSALLTVTPLFSVWCHILNVHQPPPRAMIWS